jgi:uncharacterized protein (TIGR04255 family)
MFDLEPATRYRLARSPLAQAIAQVKFPMRAKLQSIEGIAPVQEALESLFPDMEPAQVQQMAIVVGPAGPAAQKGESTRTWNFTTDDGWRLEVSPDTATLVVGSEYQGVEEFSRRFEAVLEVLAETAHVRRCTRLGLRYLNLAQAPTDDSRAWRQWFQPELIGWVGGGILGRDTTLIASITQAQLAARPIGELSGPPVDVQAIVRHGYVPSGTMVPGLPPPPLEHPAYLLDLDLYVEAPQILDPAELTAQFRILHGQIDRFFRWSLTSDGAKYFGLEERE